MCLDDYFFTTGDVFLAYIPVHTMGMWNPPRYCTITGPRQGQ